jgi:hypothetical protein
MKTQEQPNATIETEAVSPIGVQQRLEADDPPAQAAQVAKHSWLTDLRSRVQKRGIGVPLIGVGLSIVAGFISYSLWGWSIFNPASENFFWILGVVLFVLAFVGAFLLRSLWAILIVPVSWIVGAVLAATLIPRVQSTWPAVQSTINTWHIHASPSILILIFAILAGTFLGVYVYRRQHP